MSPLVTNLFLVVFLHEDIREASEFKNVTKSGKSSQIDFFEFGENRKFDEPPST